MNAPQNPEKSDRVRGVFAEAMQQPAEEREAFIERACAGDEALLAEVRMLVEAMEHASAAGFMSAPTVGTPSSVATMQSSSASEGPGARVGPYKILQLIGEGGFGSVFMAEQSKPVERRVALKIIKAGMDTRQVIARFEAERQALAMMDHPNIARVLDAGATEAGRPYFVMELVKGDPITDYCDKQNLSIDERLELFAQVCNAVQHAHQKGIIHRDIKPSNVLVSTQDGKPFAKVIDFGIAKATAARLTEKTLFTEHKTLIGTPEYMSPEQADGSLDIDTRTDVYSLGVLLYELLTGATPFDSEKLRSAAYGELQRIIREVDPPNPSTRLSENTETIGNVAAHRKTEPRKLNSIIRGELDWIVMKALEKDRHRRYESASSLAADIARYLSGEAVVAAPPSTAYRLKKFVRRNRVLVTAGSAVALALVAGVVGTGLALQRALTAEQGLRTQLTETQKAQQAERDRAEQLKKVSDFQSQMLAQIDTTKAGVELMAGVREQFVAALEEAGVPEAERTARVDALRQELVRINATDTAAAMIDRTVLKPAIKAIDEQFTNDPATDASLRQALADLYATLGLFPSAHPLQESALATRRRVLGEEHPETLTSIDSLGSLLRAQGRLTEAEPYFREALENRRRVLGEEHPDTLASLNNVGFLLRAQGKLTEAEALLREAVEKRRRVLGEEHADTLTSINDLGVLLQAEGKLDQAEPYVREALEKRRRVLGEEHPVTLQSINDVGMLLQAQGRLDEAEPYYREALEKYRRVLGEEHPFTLTSIGNMGFLLRAQDRLDEAEPFYREALEQSRRVLGEEHPETLTCMNNMAALLRFQGKFDQAESYVRETLDKRRRVLGEEHPDTLASINNLGVLLQVQGKLAEAEPYVREAMEKLRRVLGEEHPNTLAATGSLGRVLQQQGKHQEAIDLLAASQAAARKQFTGANAPRLAGLLTTLGRARAGLGYDLERFALAETNLLEAHAIYLAAKDRGPTHKDTLACVEGLVELYTAWHAAEPGKGHDVKAAEWRAKMQAMRGPVAATGPATASSSTAPAERKQP